MAVMVVATLLLLCVIAKDTDRPAGGEVTKASAEDKTRTCCVCNNTAAYMHIPLVFTMAPTPQLAPRFEAPE